MNKLIKLSITILAIFSLLVLLFLNFENIFGSITSNEELNYCISMTLWIILPIIFTKLLFKDDNPILELGLKSRLNIGFGIAFLICLPMLIGYMFFFKINHEFTFSQLMAYGLFASLGEEILFRGFLFGHLFRRAKWGIILAEFIEALIFGLLHLSQTNNTSEAIGIFAVTFSGGLWFAWLYVEWNYNLWVPIMIHFLMNAYWSMFDVAQNALGGKVANVFRLITVILSIYLTIKHGRKNNNKMMINRKNLFVNAIPAN